MRNYSYMCPKKGVDTNLQFCKDMKRLEMLECLDCKYPNHIRKIVKSRKVKDEEGRVFG